MILIDSREQQPYDFSMYKIPQKRVKIDTGDYSFKGHELEVCIERKKSLLELAHNIGQDWKRFASEPDRMQAFKAAYIICEFPYSHIDNFPFIDAVPVRLRKKIQIKPAFIYKRIEEIQNMGIIFFFCSSKAEAEQLVVQLYEETTK